MKMTKYEHHETHTFDIKDFVNVETDQSITDGLVICSSREEKNPD